MFNGIRIRTIRVDSKNNMWIGCYDQEKSVTRISGEDGSYKHFATQDGISHYQARNITELKDGAIVGGNADGVSSIRGDEVAFSLNGNDDITNSVILSVCSGGDDKYYIGTDGGGIFVIEDTHIST